MRLGSPTSSSSSWSTSSWSAPAPMRSSAPRCSPSAISSAYRAQSRQGPAGGLVTASCSRPSAGCCHDQTGLPCCRGRRPGGRSAQSRPSWPTRAASARGRRGVFFASRVPTGYRLDVGARVPRQARAGLILTDLRRVGRIRSEDGLGESPVNVIGGPGDERGPIRGQEGHQARNLIRLAVALQH